MPKLKTSAIQTAETEEQTIQAVHRKRKKKALSNISEFYALIRLFAHLIRGGTTPQDTMFLMAQGASGIFKEPLEEARHYNVDEGRSIADAFAMTEFFPPEFISILRVGQTSGHLPDALEQYGKFLNGVITTQRNFMASLKYPMLMLNAVIVGVCAIILLVVPGLKESVASVAGNEPVSIPIYTQFLFGLYDIMYVFGTPGVIAFMLGMVYYLFFGKGRQHIMILVYKIPKVRRLQESMRWAQWLIMGSICLKSGMTLAQMLVTLGDTELPKELQGGDTYKNLCNNVKYGGQTLSSELDKCNVNKRLVSLISIGEKKGYTEDILYSEGEDRMDGLPYEIAEVKTTLETLMIALVTIAGGSIMGSVMLSMFSLSSMV
ncbi:type II secretion system F family protein [uncultured Cloacibacillus sp.]|uniref:type II secretion system F family protein n=1 Tax=uncultured Cloacibacillus sp. TaxID=889794 RepID=UPI0026DD8E5B|nr:type II secretion system F family protein [uncultured Cloacibacillus sp.]